MGRRSGGVAEEHRVDVSELASIGLTRERLIEFYRLMYLSRKTDDREIVL